MCTLFGWTKRSGPFAVGVTAWHLVDASRVDPIRGGGRQERPLREWMVQVWYPAESAAGAEPEAKPLGGTVAFPEAGVWYLRREPRAGPLVMRQEPMASTVNQLLPRYGLPGAAFHQVTHLATHAYADAPAADAAGPCPVILFSGGYFIETLTSSSALMEELASHGYVVASLSHPGEELATVFPDGRMAGLDLAHPFVAGGAEALGPESEASLALWIADAKYLLDEIERRGAVGSGDPLAGRLDLGRVGAIGIAQGGKLAAELCQHDGRIGAGASLDGNVQGPVTRPFLFVNSEGRKGMNRGAAEQAREAVYQLNLRRARPLHLSGVSTWFPLLAQLADFEAGSVYRYQKALGGVVRAFFDKHLKGKDVIVEGAAREYAEAEFVG